jgi:phosphomannomutase
VDSPGPTRIKFDAAGWRGMIARDFTFASVRLASQAVAEHLKRELAEPKSPIHGRLPKVVIAHDCRFLGPQFALAAAEILAANGLTCLLCEGGTPVGALALAIGRRQAIGGINIGAGHDPPEYSGFTFCGPDGAGATPEAARRLESAVVRLQKENWSFPAVVIGTFQVRTMDPRPGYFQELERRVNFDALKKARLKIAVDLMHGCGRGYLDELLGKAGARLTIFHNESDAFFGGQAPEASAERLKEMRQAVGSGRAQLGLAVDGGAAHAAVVDQDGAWLTPGQIQALTVYQLAKHRGWTGPVARAVAEKDGILACLLMAELVATEGKSPGKILQQLAGRTGRIP